MALIVADSSVSGSTVLVDAEAIGGDCRVGFGFRIGSVAGLVVTLVVVDCLRLKSACLPWMSVMKGSLLGGILVGRVVVRDRFLRFVVELDRACAVEKRLHPFLVRRVV